MQHYGFLGAGLTGRMTSRAPNSWEVVCGVCGESKEPVQIEKERNYKARYKPKHFSIDKPNTNVSNHHFI